MIIFLVFLFLLSSGLLFWQASNLMSVFSGSPYVVANRKTIIETLKLAKLKKGEVVYDLGCGNGQVLIEASGMGAGAVGFEISPFYYLWAKIRTFRYHDISVGFQNIKTVDLKNADVIYCYLLPEFLEKLSVKFRKEMKTSCRLISVGFPIKELKLIKKTQVDTHKIYIYSLSSRSI